MKIYVPCHERQCEGICLPVEAGKSASGRGHLRHVRPCGSVWAGSRDFPKRPGSSKSGHPHCLCHYAPVYASELKGKKRSDNVEGRGNAWLKRQPLHIRQAILGVKGEQEWKAGRVGWMEKARNLNISTVGYYGLKSR